MELKTKGEAANVEAFKQLMIELSWQSGKDFDLGALLEYKEEGKGPDFIYFQNQGDLNGPFFVHLDKDAGVAGDIAEGGNKETMKIMNMDQYRQIHIVTWDYDAIEINGGAVARFGDDQVALKIMDDKANTHVATIPADIAEQRGNVVCVATIDNSSPMGATFVNQGIVGTCKKFTEVANWLEKVAHETDA